MCKIVYLRIMELKLLFILLFCIALNVECAKILGVFHFPSKSHHILGSTLLKALAKRGHQVTMLSPFPSKTPLKNYEDIDLPGMLEYKEDNMVSKLMQLQNESMFEKMSIMMDMVDKVDQRFMTHSSVKELLASNRKFDLVIQCYFGNDAYLALSHHFEAPTVAFSTIGASVLINKVTGNSAPFSYVPNLFPSFPDTMTFLQRVGNTLSVIGFELYDHFCMQPKQKRLLQKYFPQAPSADKLRSNISLVLLNSHYSIESPRPYVPSMIQVGGLHVEEPKELKGDIKGFMDTAVDGVVLFSLGSNVKSSELPQDKLNAIIGTFSKLRLKVLWKFETENVPNLSSNVKIAKWLPQRDILAHPNIKLFVTHGGLLSTTEAVYHGVPMVGIPFFGDQESNVDDGVYKGYVVKVAFLDLSEETLTKAINDVLSNSKYRENVMKRSLVLKDQPLKPLDNAVFWVEYVLRHKGAHHLKTSAIKLQWYQYYLLDVLGLLVGVLLIVCAGSYIVLCLLFRLLKKVFTKKDNGSAKISKKKPKSKLA